MSKILKVLRISTESSARLFYFLAALVAILGFTYLFGFHVLVGVIKGGDAGYASHNVLWYSRWFPNIPLWYPIQGGGFSFSLSYAILPSLISSAVAKLTTLDPVQSLRLLTFGSYFIGALGIYIFGAWRMKNQTLGLIAALIYLTLPGNWYWVTKLGYYAYAISGLAIPWIVVFFDAFLESLLVAKSKLMTLIWLFITAVVLGFGFMLHAICGLAMIVGIFIYSLIYGWLGYKKLLSFKGIAIGILAFGVVITLMVGLYSFWIIPVQTYSNTADVLGGSQTASEDLIIRWAQVQNPERMLFDWGPLELTNQFPMPPFPRVVTYLVILGMPLVLILAFVRTKLARGSGLLIASQKALAIGILGLFFLILSGLPAYLGYGFAKNFKFILSFLNFYTLSESFVFLPIVAAFAIYALVWILSEVLFSVFYVLKLRSSVLVKWLKVVVVASLSLFIFATILVKFEKGPDGTDIIGWGPMDDFTLGEKEALGFTGFYFRPEIGSSFGLEAMTKLLTSPPEISKVGYGSEKYVENLLANMEVDQFTRVGLTPRIGNLLQVWGNVTDASTLNQFLYRGSLFQSFRGFHERVFFGKDETDQDPVLLSDLARWLGYKYVVTANDENTKQYDLQDWEIIPTDSAWAIYKFKDYQTMATVSDRPRVLVIRNKGSVYESVFVASARGVLPYSSAWLVEGGQNVDAYSLDDLMKFDGLILYGYSYTNQNRAFSLLNDYVQAGGKLFIDTGWQYYSKDWQIAKAPQFFPVSSLSWSTEISPGEHAVLVGDSLDSDLHDIVLEWNGQPWGMSVPDKLRDWAKTMLSVDGKPLVAGGEYGEGYVVWSGLNLYGYLSYHKYDPELVSFAAGIFEKMFPTREDEQPNNISLQRTYPDKLTIGLGQQLQPGTALLWREPYAPNWVATLVTGKSRNKLPTYRAGPGMLMTILPQTQSGSVIVIEFSLGVAGTVGKLISFITAIVFGVVFIDAVLLQSRGFKKLVSKLLFKRIWHEEE